MKLKRFSIIVLGAALAIAVFAGVKNYGTIYIDALRMAGVDLSATEMLRLDGVTPGTTGANKYIAADANKRVDDLDVTALEVGNVDITATGTELNEYVVALDIADLSAEAVYYTVFPHAGNISKVWTVIDGAVATADVTITGAIGATPITDGVVTIATASSAAGDIDSTTPSAANAVTAGQAANWTVTGGGAGGAPRGHVYIVVNR